MDLRAEATRLGLDVLAVALCSALDGAGIGHVLLKGPSTALWLYDPPREYRDVDLLVPRSLIEDAVGALGRAGLARPAAGGVGEEAAHSLLLRSADGFEVDLHVSLPTLPSFPADGDRVWDALAAHVEPLELGVGPVPVLDLAGRCVVIALHAFGVDANPQARADLERARAAAGPDVWAAAAGLAGELGAADLFTAALDPASASSPRARLLAAGAPAAALGLERVLAAHGRDRLRLLAREVWPSEGFLRYDDPSLAPGRAALLGARARRWGRIARTLPDGLRSYRASRDVRRLL